MFSEWLAGREAEGATRTQVAFELGCHPSYLTKIVGGDGRPGLKLAFAIERATGGAIDAASWVEAAA